MLLPLRWETHSAPEYGRRPQDVINRQVVDACDLLVGVFWTRVGSPTGTAASGTLEEIERVASQGKPVMLYFSQAKQDPEKIELDQLQKLREFKKKTFPKALVETYASQIEFRDKLAKQLEIQLRTLVSEEGQEASGELKAKPVTDIQLAFADPQSGAYLGTETALESTLLQIEGADDVPDYVEPSEQQRKHRSSGQMLDAIYDVRSANKDYYREMLEYLSRASFLRPCRFWLKNVGGVGARDVFVDLRLASDQSELTVLKTVNARLSPPSKFTEFFSITGTYDGAADPALERRGDHWITYLELRALQPQREVSPPPRFVLGVENSALVTISARIYADTLSEPLLRTLKINWMVRRSAVKASELLKNAGA